MDIVQFDEPAFNVYLDEVDAWGMRALERAAQGPDLHDGRAHLLRLRHPGQPRLEEARSATSGASTRQIFPVLAGSSIDQVSLECLHSHVPPELMALLEGKDVMVGVIDVASDEVESPRGGGRHDRAARCGSCRASGSSPAPTAAWRRWTATIALAKLEALVRGAALAEQRHK